MREILFRGKRTDNREWVEGFLFRYNGAFCIQLEEIGCDDYGLYPRCYAEVIPESISEFISLTDKNGKNIFEGDILSYEYGDWKNQGFVYYYDRGAKFGIKQNDGYGNLSLLHDTQVKAWNVTVIGNIHDNPELLKGENEA